jgi:HSP20 family protein
MNRARAWREGFNIPLGNFQEELNRFLAHYRDLWPLGPTPEATATDLEPSTWVPNIDLLESPEDIRLWIEIPGIDPSSIDLTVTGPMLTVKGERHAPEPAAGRSHLSERSFGPFHRTVPLPSEVDVNAVHAESRNGVLEIRLPKAQDVRPRTIPVRPS